MEYRTVRVLLKKGSNVFSGGEMKPTENIYATGLFHGWEDYKLEDFSCKYAIVELHDGTMRKFEPENIQFTDTSARNNLV